MNKIIVHAQNAGGPEITGSKAVAIVATGGRVMLTEDTSGREVSVDGGGYLDSDRGRTKINYPSYGASSAEDAEIHGRMIQTAASLAKRALAYTGPDFTDVPEWVTATEGSPSPALASYYARSRYGAGDVTWHEAWAYAASRSDQPA